jgi:hypothetical protein
MQAKVDTIDIPEIADILAEKKSNSQRIALIIGSRAGALFRSGEFYDDLNAYSARNFADMDERTRFYECYSLLEDIYKRRRMSLKEIRSFIEGQIYGHSDVARHLAQLVKADFFKVIITNNIDDILYESFNAVGMQENVDFVDFSLGRLSCAENIKLILSQKKMNIRRLVRMAGDIDTFIGNLNRPQAQKVAGECVRSLLEHLRISEILVVGIDPAWDQAILSALPLHLETIWFINDDDYVKDQFIAKCGNPRNFYYLTGHKGNYDNFFRLLYWNLNQSITESHELIEELKSDIHNMRIDLQHIKKKSEEASVNMKLLQTKMDSIILSLEELSGIIRSEGDNVSW